MRYLRALFPLVLSGVVVWLLNRPLVSLPALGRLLDPLNGALAAAEPDNADWNRLAHLDGLQAPVTVWMDSSLIPHLRAANDHDLYYTQGYVHAQFRLWQMDMQTRAAGGRVSEVAGPKAVDFDRGMRREGMVWGAQRSLAAMERDPRTKAMLDAYRDGINACIHSLSYRTLPLEYKLMGFYPEDWTNLRTALLMKYMARDLTGKTDDVAFTLLRDELGQEQFDFLFPERIAGSMPVIPKGTAFETPSLAQPPIPGDSVWAHFDNAKSQKPGASKGVVLQEDRDGASGIGSNNWAISGKHTVSGKPILCNDPHLGLNLPSLWYEMQLTAPGINVYGASLPGAPGVVIGFNEKIAWGFTNNYRDVKDFYRITPRPSGGAYTAYQFNGQWTPFERNVEVIKVKGGADILDTVLYTVHGPVTYDPNYPGADSTGALLACTWMGHRGSNELLSVYLLNRAENYNAFTQAISHFECPAQNFAYADGAGNIAMWGQGRFINKWKAQGKYVMEGRDSRTLWGAAIPWQENPHVLNPPQGYVASANQQVTDSMYPYWYNQSATEWRSWSINMALSRLVSDTNLRAVAMHLEPRGWDSFYALPYRALSCDELQNDVTSVLLQRLMPLALFERERSATATDCFPAEMRLEATSKRATGFQVQWALLHAEVWKHLTGIANKLPASERTVELLVHDSASVYFDDPATAKRETLRDVLERVEGLTLDSLERLRKGGGSEWYQVKNTSLTHLAKLPAFSYDHLKIGGWSNTINAVTGNHGPSWRMIVEMDAVPKAYTIYPGGQSGNPGSRHYGDFVDPWVGGRYHAAQFLTAATRRNPLPYTWTLLP